MTGMEAVGVVTAVGPGLTGRKVGDLVAYAGTPMGAYAEEQILPAEKVVPVPPSVDPIIAASIMLKGMTAQFLLHQCFKVGFLFAHTFMFHRAGEVKANSTISIFPSLFTESVPSICDHHNSALPYISIMSVDLLHFIQFMGYNKKAMLRAICMDRMTSSIIFLFIFYIAILVEWEWWLAA